MIIIIITNGNRRKSDILTNFDNLQNTSIFTVQINQKKIQLSMQSL